MNPLLINLHGLVECYHGGESEPGNGWLLCDGRPLDRKKYDDLYNVIRANFGAPDETQFNLPDLRGRFVRGVDPDDEEENRDPDRYNRIASAPGGNAGNRVGSLQEDKLAEHAHGYVSPIKSSEVKGNQMQYGKELRVSQYWETDRTGGQETRPKNVYVNWIIYAGV